jgi:hypothetical protein
MELNQKAQELKLASLEAFRNQLRLPELLDSVKTDDRLFISIIKHAVNDYDVTLGELAERLGVSPPAVGRWGRAVHLPPAYGRQAVIEALAAVVEERVNSRQPAPRRAGRRARI